jgi:peptidoglycan/LPS O-acetylase OafA/YrhL
MEMTGVAEASAGERRNHIPALDGLRFVAAVCVMVGHGFWYIILMQQEPSAPWALDFIVRAALPSVGMTLFFVLSGFVIHLNYRATAGLNARGAYAFFAARFARLYPMFLFVFSIGGFTALLWFHHHPDQLPVAGGIRALLEALPLHLTFTQVWWLWPIGPYSAYNIFWMSFFSVTGVTWSLSTEWFFYVCYPFIARTFSRLKGEYLGIAALVIGALGIFYYTSVLEYRPQIINWAAKHYPYVPNDEMFHWMAFLSPWGRISEFLLGVVAAQYYLTQPALSRWWAEIATWVCAGSLIVVTVAIYTTGSPFNNVATSCYAALFALAVFLIAQNDTSLSRALSTSFMVKGGEASYSLYLLHGWIIGVGVRSFAGTHPNVPRIIVLLAGILISLGVARISYLLVERPSTHLVRRALTQRRRRSEVAVSAH